MICTLVTTLDTVNCQQLTDDFSTVLGNKI